jgi:membrane protein implicated in regulation of membrane protease activity
MVLLAIAVSPLVVGWVGLAGLALLAFALLVFFFVAIAILLLWNISAGESIDLRSRLQIKSRQHFTHGDKIKGRQTHGQ